MNLDHRPAVAAMRREKMRARLIEAAVLVAASKGLEKAAIDDITLQAAVSRGTFYNHFLSVPDLMSAAQEELGNEIAVATHAAVFATPDPDERLARAISVYLATARSYPMVAQFISALGMQGLGTETLIAQLLYPYLAAGVATGDFCDLPLMLAFDLMAATASATLLREARGETIDPEALIAVLLRGVGVARDRAQELAQMPMQPLEVHSTSLIARSHAIWLQGR